MVSPQTAEDKKILISGAGIAGTTLAYWLHRGGFKVTIVERAPEIRDSGHAVEISAPAARKIARDMGIDRAVHEKGTTEKGLKFVNDRGRVISTMEMDKVYGRSFTSEDEILRGDLAQILYKTIEDLVDFRFDDYVTDIRQDTDAVDVVFNSGKRESFNHLVICDGLHSKARTLAGFDHDQVEILPFRLATAFFTIQDKIIDLEDKYAKWYTTHGARHMMLRPDATGKNTRGYFTFAIDEPLDRKLSIAQQKDLVTRKYTGCAYVVDQILDGMNSSAPDFYMTDIAQVKASSWSKGRIALCGDAAYCPSPMSGAGVDCAMTG
ncbi:FAD binding domain protein, partial [Taphrina deformans PYCC 5710]